MTQPVWYRCWTKTVETRLKSTLNHGNSMGELVLFPYQLSSEGRSSEANPTTMKASESLYSILLEKQDICWIKWSTSPLPGAESSPAKRSLTLLCLDQSHRIAWSLFFTSCIDSAAIASKCSAHSLQAKKLRMYLLIVGRTSGVTEEAENETRTELLTPK